MSEDNKEKKEPKKVERVEVHITDEGMNAVLDQNSKLMDMVEKGNLPVKTSDSEEKLPERIQQMNEKFHTERFSIAQSSDELRRMTTDYINEIAEKSKALEGQHSAPSGSAPLNEQQYGKKLGKGTYPNIQALIEDLRDREENGDKNASKIIDKLFEKALSHAKSTNTSIPQYDVKELETEISKEGFKVLVHPEDSDLYKMLHSKGRRAVKARLQQLQQSGDQ